MARTNDSMVTGTSTTQSNTITQGVVLLAFNNGVIDYVQMAAWSAQRIHRHLGLPVTLITNVETADTVFDSVVTMKSREATTRWFGDYGQTMPWYNANRADVYKLSPYQQTLVLDTDYIVCSNQLLTLFHSGQNFLCHGRAVDAAYNADYNHNNQFGRYAMPMKWATVLYYQRSTFAEAVFAMIDMINQNWTHYRNLYGITNPTYRSDYAVSVALHTVNGQLGAHPDIAWNLINVEPQHRLIQLANDKFKIEFVSTHGSRYVTMDQQDFHAMNKQDLGVIIASSR